MSSICPQFTNLLNLSSVEPLASKTEQHLEQTFESLLWDHQDSLNLPETVFLVPLLKTSYFLMPSEHSDMSQLKDLGSAFIIREMEEQGITDFEIDKMYISLVSAESINLSNRVDSFVKTMDSLSEQQLSDSSQ